MTTDLKNIVLTGFMGTGKTTVGKRLAKRLDYDFVDTDVLIEQRAGRSIPEIFEHGGEAVFRQLEAEIAQELALSERLVIATGGGMMVNPDNAAVLSQSGLVFCLVASPEEILSRLLRDTDHPRPLLAVPDPHERILALLRQREAVYGRFPQLVTTGKQPDEIVTELQRRLSGC